MARTQKLIDKYKNLGLAIPLNYKEHQKSWRLDNQGQCDYCHKHNVNIQEYDNELNICFKCYNKNWWSYFEWDVYHFETIADEDTTPFEKADELFTQFLKETNE